jgi:hypothetical protein
VPTGAKESFMHPKIKALMEKYGKTLEQVKAEHAAEYQQALEAVAADQNTFQEAAARLPEVQAQLARVQAEHTTLTAQLAASEAARLSEGRTRLVDDALTVAALPALAPFQDGDTTVDLNADFRAALLAEALAADSDAAATLVVDRRVRQEKHRRGERVPATESLTPSRMGGPALPTGNNDAPDLGVQLEGFASTNPLLTGLR